MSGYHRKDLPLIGVGGWRTQAACTERVREMLWDDRLEGESDDHRDERHGKAMAVCNRVCTVREQCGDGVDPKIDEGVRGGHRLPTLHAIHTAAESELLRLLGRGFPLDQAARGAQRVQSREKAS